MLKILKQVKVKIGASFINCISEINYIQVYNAEDIGLVRPMYNLIESINNISKTTGDLWLYYRDEPITNDAGVITDFTVNDNSESFKFKQKTNWSN